MTHVFVAPHPDDVALSCGGLIASLRELGQTVTIVTVFSGDGSGDPLTPYQREALGFGLKAMWPATEAFNRSDILADWPTAALVPAWACVRGPTRCHQSPTRTRRPSGSGSTPPGIAGASIRNESRPTSRS